jgi:hypothetical protein
MDGIWLPDPYFTGLVVNLDSLLAFNTVRGAGRPVAAMLDASMIVPMQVPHAGPSCRYTARAHPSS